ncbi:MAG TPA: EF-hand domain-containing protein [Candidatus Sulfotelmatobacter sp.]|jgi:hypothetical protein|nr:EF-hand domain-containing protein [Candidatus Sulfotelmatobacter sp.]
MTPFRHLPLFAAASLFLILTACSHGPDKAPPPKAQLLFSPNGEPITGGPLGQASCEDAMARWFDRLDSRQSGLLNREDFMADARAQFARMDLDHDGWITPSELSEFRAPYAPPPEPMRGGPGGGNGGPGGSGPSGGPNGGHGGPAGGGSPGGGSGGSSASRSSVTQEDPVMAADVHLQFRVSQEDFLAQASDVFNRLDKTHKGALSKPDAIAFCPVKSAAR